MWRVWLCEVEGVIICGGCGYVWWRVLLYVEGVVM